MIGVILAAGVGSRLRPLTSGKPKCLVKVAGKPILQYQIDAYVKAGIEELIIVVGYEGNEIREYCKHIKRIRIRVIANRDYETTNNMYSLFLIRDVIAGKAFILNNSDLCIDPDIVLELVRASDCAIAVDTSVFTDESMKIMVTSDGLISNIAKDIAKQDAFACSIDFYKFSADASSIFFTEINRIINDENRCNDWTEVAMQRLFMERRLSFHPCDISGRKWVEIDDYCDLSLADRKFSNYDDLVASVNTFIFDLDGTLYVGGRSVPGAGRVIEQLRQKGKSVYFLSNNSSKSKTMHVGHLADVGVAAQEGEIILSTDILIRYLLETGVKKVFVLGTNEFEEAIRDSGIQTGCDDPEFVVVGYDTSLTYAKLVSACTFLNQGVDLLASHSDVSCPAECGPIPDIGAILQMLEATTGVRPVEVFGKPSTSMIGCLPGGKRIDPATTMVIGDRLHMDIQMANTIGAYSLLVLTGGTRRDELENSEVQPDFILDSVADMYEQSAVRQTV